MRVLIACEYSGRVRDAFLSLGHEAMSCDLLPTESPGPHYQGDIRDVLDYPWELAIFHPPCTDLAVSGARHFADKRMVTIKDPMSKDCQYSKTTPDAGCEGCKWRASDEQP